MHSSVFVYTENKNLRKEDIDVTEDSLYESGFENYCDYLRESNTDNEFNSMFRWLESCFKNNDKVICNFEEKSLTFFKGSSENYFSKNFDIIKSKLEAMDLTQFCSSNKIYELKWRIDDDHGFYMVDEYGCFASLDHFMRNVADLFSVPNENIKEYKIYIVKTMDYHF